MKIVYLAKRHEPKTSKRFFLAVTSLPELGDMLYTEGMPPKGCQSRNRGLVIHRKSLSQASRPPRRRMGLVYST